MLGLRREKKCAEPSAVKSASEVHMLLTKQSLEQMLDVKDLGKDKITMTRKEGMLCLRKVMFAVAVVQSVGVDIKDTKKIKLI